MRRNPQLPILLALLAIFVAALPAAAATLEVTFTNQGRPLDDPKHGRFYVYPENNRDSYLDWGHAARTAQRKAYRRMSDHGIGGDCDPLRGDCRGVGVTLIVSPVYLRIAIAPVHPGNRQITQGVGCNEWVPSVLSRIKPEAVRPGV